MSGMIEMLPMNFYCESLKCYMLIYLGGGHVAGTCDQTQSGDAAQGGHSYVLLVWSSLPHGARSVV